MFIILFFSGNSVNALQCGDKFINVGDLKSKVFLICGKPLSKEVIGYIDHVESEKRIRVMKIEEWVIEVKVYDVTYFYSLVFEGNKLKEITSVGMK
jgi:hypothetical protein